MVAGATGLGSSLTPFPAPRAGGELSTSGIYRRVRHPMYGGGILFALGWSILTGSAAGLVLSAGLVLFFECKSRREERWLLDRYAGYADYRRRTPRRFVPFVYGPARGDASDQRARRSSRPAATPMPITAASARTPKSIAMCE